MKDVNEIKERIKKYLEEQKGLDVTECYTLVSLLKMDYLAEVDETLCPVEYDDDEDEMDILDEDPEVNKSLGTTERADYQDECQAEAEAVGQAMDEMKQENVEEEKGLRGIRELQDVDAEPEAKTIESQRVETVKKVATPIPSLPENHKDGINQLIKRPKMAVREKKTQDEIDEGIY